MSINHTRMLNEHIDLTFANKLPHLLYHDHLVNGYYMQAARCYQ